MGLLPKRTQGRVRLLAARLVGRHASLEAGVFLRVLLMEFVRHSFCDGGAPTYGGTVCSFGRVFSGLCLVRWLFVRLRACACVCLCSCLLLLACLVLESFSETSPGSDECPCGPGSRQDISVASSCCMLCSNSKHHDDQRQASLKISTHSRVLLDAWSQDYDITTMMAKIQNAYT